MFVAYNQSLPLCLWLLQSGCGEDSTIVAWVTWPCSATPKNVQYSCMLRPAMFWLITQRLVTISYWRFGTTYRLLSCAETLVIYCHYSLRNNSSECSFHLFCSRNLKSLIHACCIACVILLYIYFIRVMVATMGRCTEYDPWLRDHGTPIPLHPLAQCNQSVCWRYAFISQGSSKPVFTYLLTYLLHGAESFLRS